MPYLWRGARVVLRYGALTGWPRLPSCHWCWDPVAPEDEVGDGVDYIAHADCHEIQT